MSAQNGNAASITIGAARPEAVVAEFLGKNFEVQRITKPLANQITIAEAKAEQSESGDDLVTAVGELLDLYLKPHGGHRTKASKLVLERWNDEEDPADIGEITAYAQNVQQVAIAPPR